MIEIGTNIKSNFKEWMQHGIDDTVVDYKNPSCNNCDGCCDYTTSILLSEYKALKKYFKTPEGKLIYKEAKKNQLKAARLLVEENTLSFKCYFLTDSKRCRLYSHRPSVCRDFHCTSALAKENFNRDEYVVDHLCIQDLF